MPAPRALPPPPRATVGQVVPARPDSVHAGRPCRMCALMYACLAPVRPSRAHRGIHEKVASGGTDGAICMTHVTTCSSHAPETDRQSILDPVRRLHRFTRSVLGCLEAPQIRPWRLPSCPVLRLCNPLRLTPRCASVARTPAALGVWCTRVRAGARVRLGAPPLGFAHPLVGRGREPWLALPAS